MNTKMKKLRDDGAQNYFVMGHNLIADKYLPMAYQAGFDAAAAIYEAREAKLVEALEKYADGTAFDFNRNVRGEINFDAGLSCVTAREALAAHQSEGEG